VKHAARIPPMKQLAIGLAAVFLSVCARAQDSYRPPPESAAVVSKIRFSEARPIGQSFRERFSSCDEHDVCLRKPQSCSNDKSRNKALLQLPGGTIFFEAKMAIDTDGSKLSRTLYEQRKKAGKAVIDQPDTSLRYSDGTSLDADTVPYIAVPGGGFRDALGVDKGDIVAVIYKGTIAYALVGDVGPACKIGEGSLRLHEQLGNKACVARDTAGVCTRAANQSIDAGVLYFIFPGSRARIVPGLTPGNINERIKVLGPELMKTLGTP
jgi:Fungal chitosanase of glycosyl hydrolase group 75